MKLSKKLLSPLLLLSLCTLGCENREKKVEQHINEFIIPLGTRVVNDHRIILRPSVDDNRFTEVHEVVTGIVAANPKIVRGIFMDDSRVPWVNVHHKNPEGFLIDMNQLSDSIALWAEKVSDTVSMKRFTSVELDSTGAELIEFAAPIITKEGYRLGTIRYTYTTGTLPK